MTTYRRAALCAVLTMVIPLPVAAQTYFIGGQIETKLVVPKPGTNSQVQFGRESFVSLDVMVERDAHVYWEKNVAQDLNSIDTFAPEVMRPRDTVGNVVLDGPAPYGFASLREQYFLEMTHLGSLEETIGLARRMDTRYRAGRFQMPFSMPEDLPHHDRFYDVYDIGFAANLEQKGMVYDIAYGDGLTDRAPKYYLRVGRVQEPWKAYASLTFGNNQELWGLAGSYRRPDGARMVVEYLDGQLDRLQPGNKSATPDTNSFFAGVWYPLQPRLTGTLKVRDTDWGTASNTTWKIGAEYKITEKGWARLEYANESSDPHEFFSKWVLTTGLTL